MWCKDSMKFVDEIDFGGVSLFVLTAHHEVHLLQLVEEPNALLCDMSAFALLSGKTIVRWRSELQN